MMIMHHLLLSYFGAWQNLFIIAQKSLTSYLIPDAIYWCLCAMHQIIWHWLDMLSYSFRSVLYFSLVFFVCLFFSDGGNA